MIVSPVHCQDGLTVFCHRIWYIPWKNNKNNYFLHLGMVEHVANSYLEATLKKPKVVSEFKVITQKERLLKRHSFVCENIAFYNIS